jgi:Uma2 family endonuclease
VWNHRCLPRPSEPDRFTHADIDALAGSGLQCELLDGVLVLTPPQGPLHHAAVAGCLGLLAPRCPADLWVLTGCLDYRPSPQISFQVDLMVCRREDLAGRAIEQPPLLAVEVQTAVARSMDQSVKRAVYQEAGIASYWMFDPERQVLTVLELVDGQYLVRAVVTGDEVFETELPFGVRFVPGQVVRR